MNPITTECVSTTLNTVRNVGFSNDEYREIAKIIKKHMPTLKEFYKHVEDLPIDDISSWIDRYENIINDIENIIANENTAKLFDIKAFKTLFVIMSEFFPAIFLCLRACLLHIVSETIKIDENLDIERFFSSELKEISGEINMIMQLWFHLLYSIMEKVAREINKKEDHIMKIPSYEELAARDNFTCSKNTYDNCINYIREKHSYIFETNMNKSECTIL